MKKLYETKEIDIDNIYDIYKNYISQNLYQSYAKHYDEVFKEISEKETEFEKVDLIAILGETGDDVAKYITPMLVATPGIGSDRILPYEVLYTNDDNELEQCFFTIRNAVDVEYLINCECPIKKDKTYIFRQKSINSENICSVDYIIYFPLGIVK